MEKMKTRMEELRDKLNEMIDDIDSCDKEKLLEISRELDKTIHEYIKTKTDRN